MNKRHMLSLLVPLLLLSGCQTHQETTAVCQGIEQTELTLKARNNTILSSIETRRFSYVELGLPSDGNKNAEFIDQFIAHYSEGLNGISIQVIEIDQGLSLTLSIDYQKASLDELNKKGMIAKDTKQIGLEETIASLRSLGYSCSEK